MQHPDLTETILDAFAELVALHTAAAAAAERVWSALAEHGGRGERAIVCPKCHHRQLVSGRPRTDATTFSVSWRGRRCDLGPGISFKLMQRLSQFPNRYYSYDTLMADVWQRRCSNSTVRSAVKRLRRALCDADMADLAAAIRGRGVCYGMILEELSS